PQPNANVGRPRLALATTCSEAMAARRGARSTSLLGWEIRKGFFVFPFSLQPFLSTMRERRARIARGKPTLVAPFCARTRVLGFREEVNPVGTKGRCRVGRAEPVAFSAKHVGT